jgi:hypothetical protein
MAAAEQNRPDVAEKRVHWHERLAGDPPARLVFVDESGANTKMTRLGGRALVGQRLTAHVPHGHYQTTTMVCAVRLSGPSAPCLFEGAISYAAKIPHSSGRRNDEAGANRISRQTNRSNLVIQAIPV